jgi:GNAT superfamily N-acetyltransferase
VPRNVSSAIALPCENSADHRAGIFADLQECPSVQLYFRDALDADVEDLVDVLLGGRIGQGADDPAYIDDYVDALREIDHTDGSYLLVAELGGRIVGMLQLFTFRHFQHRGGRCAEIESMHIVEDQASTGVGGQLLDYAVSRAKDLGCYRVQLTSNAKRDDAHRVYEDHGFKATHKGFKQYLDLDWTPSRSAGRRTDQYV